MGNWDDHTIAAATLLGVEAEFEEKWHPDQNPKVTTETKRAFRDRFRPYVQRLIAAQGTTEVAFYDQVMGLASTHDVRQTTDRALELEYGHTVYASKSFYPGTGDVTEKRMLQYDVRVTALLRPLVTYIERAVTEGDLTFTATRTAEANDPVWSI